MDQDAQVFRERVVERITPDKPHRFVAALG